MKPAPFDYVRASDLDHALELLAYSEGEAKLIAGGQSLNPMLRLRLAAPTLLIDISRLPELRRSEDSPNGLRVGAGITHYEIERGATGAAGALARLPVLGRTAPLIGHAPIRTRGTFGGSIAHADPASEWCLLARLLDARVTARNMDGEREIPAETFFEGFLTNALHDDEILTSVLFPSLPTAAVVLELTRRHGDFAIAAVGAAVWMTGTTCDSFHLALGGVGSTVLRATAAEQLLTAGSLTEAAIAEAAELAAQDLAPSADIHGPTEYRRHLVKVLTRRALSDLVQQIEDGTDD